MNEIVRKHFPASKLPDELRAGIDPRKQVTVTVVEEEGSGEALSIEAIFALRQPPYRTREDIDAHIAALRAEWDER